MTTYRVHPAFESENVLEVEAGSVKEAALAYLAKRPVRRSLFVSSGFLSEVIVDVEELAREYPDLRTLLDLTSPAIPNPAKYLDEAEEDEPSWLEHAILLRLKVTGVILLVAMIIIPFRSNIPTALRVADAIVLAVIAVGFVLVIRSRWRKNRSQGI